MVAEEIWRGLTAGRSVHLQNWPDANLLPKADDLVVAMDQVREVSSVALSLRKASFLRVRLPLNKLTVVTAGAADLKPFADIIADELNLKSVDLVELSLDSASEFGVIKRLSVNARAAGPRLGKNVQSVIQAAKAGDWSQADGKVIAGGVELVEGEYDLDLVADFAGGSDETPTDLIGILASGGFLILDGRVTPELADEGLARDTVRIIQQARKDAGFDVSDRISLSVTGDAAVIQAIRTHEELVCAETLSVEITLIESESLNAGLAVGENQQVEVAVAKR
jgi:isoleucyl-tRNA synthetase